MKPVMKAALPKCRYILTIARVIWYGPFIYGEIGIHDPFYNATAHQVVTFVQEIVCQSQTGSLLRTSAKELRLEVGFNYGMQDINYDVTRDYIIDCWYSRLIKTTHDSPLCMEDNIFELELLRVNNEFTMGRFMDIGYDGTYLRILNHVRMHLHAITLADITTADSKSIFT